MTTSSVSSRKPGPNQFRPGSGRACPGSSGLKTLAPVLPQVVTSRLTGRHRLVFNVRRCRRLGEPTGSARGWGSGVGLFDDSRSRRLTIIGVSTATSETWPLAACGTSGVGSPCDDEQLGDRQIVNNRHRGRLLGGALSEVRGSPRARQPRAAKGDRRHRRPGHIIASAAGVCVTGAARSLPPPPDDRHPALHPDHERSRARGSRSEPAGWMVGGTVSAISPASRRRTSVRCRDDRLSGRGGGPQRVGGAVSGPFRARSPPLALATH
ncbi:hypothetical protein BW41_03364 [Sphingomonas sp. RIT328]|nr:hypothetical protein BW41_03364 [Sphingomonas sp. RIT328]